MLRLLLVLLTSLSVNAQDFEIGEPSLTYRALNYLFRDFVESRVKVIPLQVKYCQIYVDGQPTETRRELAACLWDSYSEHESKSVYVKAFAELEDVGELEFYFRGKSFVRWAISYLMGDDKHSINESWSVEFENSQMLDMVLQSLVDYWPKFIDRHIAFCEKSARNTRPRHVSAAFIPVGIGYIPVSAITVEQELQIRDAAIEKCQDQPGEYLGLGLFKTLQNKNLKKIGFAISPTKKMWTEISLVFSSEVRDYSLPKLYTNYLLEERPFVLTTKQELIDVE